jgi:membrane complex biogenesis BtpA family protein
MKAAVGRFAALFGTRWPLIGVLHAPPLPGSPRHALPFDAIAAHVLADARALLDAGFDALLVENFGDAPFHPESVEPHTVAALALLVDAVRRLASVPVGVNVLRNDARSAIGVAAAAGAAFVRVNVHTGAMVTDQGVLQGRAHETLRYREALRADVAIFADVLVKHAAPLAALPIETAARDTFRRGLADALIVTGSGTGEPADAALVARVAAAVPEARVLVGSGLTPQSLPETRRVAHGAIVGTWLKERGEIERPVDPERARALVAARG